MIFVSLDNFEKLYAVRKQNVFIQKLIVYDDIETNVSKLLRFVGVTTFRRVIDFNEAVPHSSDFRCSPQPMKENVSLILCSSGTTGLPKGVQITQYNAIFALQAKINQKSNEFGSEEIIVLGILPWFHTIGLLVSITMIIKGIKSVFLPRFDEEQCFRCIEVIDHFYSFSTGIVFKSNLFHFRRTKRIQFMWHRQYWCYYRRVISSKNTICPA